MNNLIDDVISDFLNKVQKKYIECEYKEKTKQDKITCKICGKTYQRQYKGAHLKTKKHSKAIENIKIRITNIFEN